MTVAQSQRPAGPTDVAMTALGEDSIKVSWSLHPEGAADYRVTWAPSDEDFRGPRHADWNAVTAGTSHTITDLDAGTAYKVKVKARFDEGPASLWSSAATATTDAESDPPPQAQQSNSDDPDNDGSQQRDARSNHLAPPENLMVDLVTHHETQISWDIPSSIAHDVTHARVARTGGGLMDDSAVNDAMFANYHDRSLQPNATYTFKVSLGTSSISFGEVAEIQATTLPIAKPTDLRVTTSEYYSTVIKWDGPDFAAGLQTNVETREFFTTPVSSNITTPMKSVIARNRRIQWYPARLTITESGINHQTKKAMSTRVPRPNCSPWLRPTCRY